MQVTVQTRELMLEGVLSIVEGLNPKLIRTKLDAYLARAALRAVSAKAAAAKGRALPPASLLSAEG
jgi:flagellar motor component MotA